MQYSVLTIQFWGWWELKCSTAGKYHMVEGCNKFMNFTARELHENNMEFCLPLTKIWAALSILILVWNHLQVYRLIQERSDPCRLCN